jgi:solute carrier family 8 (sodium/calcium exchanger)
MKLWKVVALWCVVCTARSTANAPAHDVKPSHAEAGKPINHTEENSCNKTEPCREGLVLRFVWKPIEGYSKGEMVGRAFVYFTFFAYFFLGVSILSDKFVESIEVRSVITGGAVRKGCVQVITSKEHAVKITKPGTKEEIIVMVPVWNETVANLTLSALGSATPEIMLNIIEICVGNYKIGK